MNTLYLLIVGSRTIINYNQIAPTLDALINSFVYDSYVVVSGGAKGVDFLAELWADNHKFEKRIFKADWKLYGKKAGFIRNEEMHKFIAQYSNRLVVAFWDGQSKGTQQNFGLAEKYKNPLVKYLVK